MHVDFNLIPYMDFGDFFKILSPHVFAFRPTILGNQCQKQWGMWSKRMDMRARFYRNWSTYSTVVLKRPPSK